MTHKEDLGMQAHIVLSVPSRKIGWRSQWVFRSVGLLIVLTLLSLPIVLLEVSPIAPDPSLYMALGLNLSQGKGYVDTGGQLFLLRAPLYPLLLALSFRLFGPSLQSALLVTKSFGILTLLIVLLLGKRLYGFRVGLIGMALIASASYLNQIPARLLLDGVHAFFVLLVLYLVVIGFERRRQMFFIFAGLCLGLAFWVKQTAILFLPLPALFFLLIDDYRQWYLYVLKSFLAYWLAAVGVVAVWWAYTFAETGQVYLLQNKGYELTSAPVIFFMAIIFLGTVLYFWPERWFTLGLISRVSMSKGRQKYAKINKFLPIILGVILLAAFEMFSWVGLNRPPSELPNHASYIPQYFTEHIISGAKAQPLLRFAPWAWLLIAILAIRGSKQDRAMFLAGLLYLPILLLISMPLPVMWGPRHLLVLYLLSYIALARSIAYIVSQVGRYLSAGLDKLRHLAGPAHFLFSYLAWFWLRKANTLSWGLVSLAVIFSLNQGLSFLTVQNNGDPLDNCGWYSYVVVNLSDWLENSVPAGTPVMSTWMFSWSTYFITGGRYPVYGIPLERDSRVVEEKDSPRMVTGRHAEGVSELLYWREGLGGEIYPYTTLSEKDLLNDIRKYDIEYLLITAGAHPFLFQALPSYFLDNPAFDEVYRQTGKCGESIHVLRVNLSRLGPRDYPLIMSANAVFELLRKGESGETDVWKLIQALGDKGIRVEPEDSSAATAYSLLADMYLEYGQEDAAFDKYKRAVAIDPYAVPYLPTERAIARWLAEAGHDSLAAIALGNLYVAEGETEAALIAYQQAVAASPDDPWPYLYLAQAYLTQGEMTKEDEAFKKALQAYRQAFALAPDDPEVRDALIQAYLALGDQYFEQDLLSQVIAAYEKAIALDPDNIQAYWKLAQVYETLGRMDDAIAVYTRATDHWPDRADAHFRLGQAYEAGGDVEKAVAEYQRAVELEPTLTGAYTRLGNLYRNQDRTEDAIALYQAAARKNPTAAWPHIELGKVYLEHVNAP